MSRCTQAALEHFLAAVLCAVCATGAHELWESVDSLCLCSWVRQHNVSNTVAALACNDGLSLAELSEVMNLPQNEQRDFCSQFQIPFEEWRRLKTSWTNGAVCEESINELDRNSSSLVERDAADREKFEVSTQAVETSCSACRNISTRMRKLFVSLRFATEDGLRPWVDAGGATFSGLNNKLIQNSFVGRNIAFFGDSTLRTLLDWLCALLEWTPVSVIDSLDSSTLRKASTMVEPCPPWTVHDRDWECIEKTVGWFFPFCTKNATESCELFWQAVARFKPQVVVANYGLHMLHFFGAGRNPEPFSILRWINYERWLAEMWSGCKALGVEVLLFKTTNLICSEKYYGAFAEGDRLFSANDEATLANCTQLVSEVLQQVGGADLHDIENYCRNATFNAAGSANLNARLEAFVRQLPATSLSGPRVLLFPDHEMQNCAYTKEGDGRHFQDDLVRIRVLGNVLSCLFSRDQTCS